MARTTLILDDTQMVRLKNLARAQGRTMTDLINEFIAERVWPLEQFRNLKNRSAYLSSIWVVRESIWPIEKPLKR